MPNEITVVPRPIGLAPGICCKRATIKKNTFEGLVKDSKSSRGTTIHIEQGREVILFAFSRLIPAKLIRLSGIGDARKAEILLVCTRTIHHS